MGRQWGQWTHPLPLPLTKFKSNSWQVREKQHHALRGDPPSSLQAADGPVWACLDAWANQRNRKTRWRPLPPTSGGRHSSTSQRRPKGRPWTRGPTNGISARSLGIERTWFGRPCPWQSRPPPARFDVGCRFRRSPQGRRQPGAGLAKCRGWPAGPLGQAWPGEAPLRGRATRARYASPAASCPKSA